MPDALETVEAAAGGSFVAGVALPIRFAGLTQEWAAVRQGCGLLDARFRGLLRVAGGDHETFLQGMLTNDVVHLNAGQGVYAALLTIQGRIVADLFALRLAEEMWLDLPAARVDVVRETLDRYIIADDVELLPAEATAPLIAFEGPEATAVVSALIGGPVPTTAFAHLPADIDGVTFRIAAMSHGGAPGYVFYGSPSAAAALWERGRAAGAEPVGMEALDILRLEAGIPWYGRDMDDETLISEVGIESAISYRKGCYLGQEVVERVASRGQVQRKLVGLVCEGEAVPAVPIDLVDAGKDVGRITSAAWSPACKAVIALGYVRRGYWEPGATVAISTPDGRAAHVVPLPFVNPSRAPTP
ncbi:hypothetical protein L6Q96_14415 [Candidatus Binatia bacterium]|nr:hypothetical protein [Candidatus Binatia bacterium]